MHFYDMFFRGKDKTRQEAMSHILPTSKFDLKMRCIAIAKGNIEKAEKLYDFFAKDIELPDMTPPVPTKLQQLKEAAGGLFGWIKENGNDLLEAYNFVLAAGRKIPASRSGGNVPEGDLPPMPPEKPV